MVRRRVSATGPETSAARRVASITTASRTAPQMGRGRAKAAVVLFGCGSQTIVDVEESCLRLGLEISAIVKNSAGTDFPLAHERIMPVDALSAAIRRCCYAVPFFTPGYRLAAHQDAVDRGFTHPATIIDPSATVASSASFGAGTYVNAGAVIGGAARIGEFVFINRGASIGHHVEIGDFASVGPGAIICGGTRIGRGTVVAAGAIVLEQLTIGRNAIVAAGAVVRRAVGDHCLVAGNPARTISRSCAGYRGLSV